MCVYLFMCLDVCVCVYVFCLFLFLLFVCLVVCLLFLLCIREDVTSSTQSFLETTQMVLMILISPINLDGCFNNLFYSHREYPQPMTDVSQYGDHT